MNYTDVVAGGDGFTMVLRMTGGMYAKLHAPFLIFKNRNRSYPMKNLPDNIDGVTYRTGPSAWMDQFVFKEWLLEPRAISKDIMGRKRVLMMDNCSGQKITEEASNSLNAINTNVMFLPSNTTHLCQPLDSFIIKDIKTIWRRYWEEEKNKKIIAKHYLDGPKSSGKIQNPGKQYYMKLAAKCVEEVNLKKDRNGNSIVRKAMIRCGMSLNYSGVWETEQPFDHLQDIIKCHPEEFNGKIPEY